MNVLLERMLEEKFQNLYLGKLKWGFECDNGWFQLLYALSKKLSHSVEVLQVKEKFGTLRFYISGGTEDDQAAVSKAENMSLHICELCGMDGEINNYKVLCEHCRLEGEQ